jgi:hypothetical protein
MTNPFTIVVNTIKSLIVDEQQNRLHAALSGKMGQLRSLSNRGNRLAVFKLADESICDEQ